MKRLVTWWYCKIRNEHIMPLEPVSKVVCRNPCTACGKALNYVWMVGRCYVDIHS